MHLSLIRHQYGQQRLISNLTRPLNSAYKATERMSSALTSLAYDFSVSMPTTAPAKGDAVVAGRPKHHLNDTKSKFVNPWDSFREPPSGFMLRLMGNSIKNNPKVPQDVESLLSLQKPSWGVGAPAGDIKATWLGHACYLVEFPTPPGATRGLRIIFDPALSHRCSPSQFMGPGRYTKVPCAIEDIPAVDAIVLSHNHYDHTDTNTLTKLTKLYQPHIFAPLGNDAYLASIRTPKTHIHVLDWWDSADISLSLPLPAKEGEPVKGSFKITCTPCQHFSSRTMWDQCATLWSSWAVEEIKSSEASEPGKKVYFAGDTAYRTVYDGEDEDKVPVCPAFKEIGEKLGPFDLAMIPIGAYSPRSYFSHIHASPSDAVRIFEDVKAKKALAMHWGTWVLTTEPIMEPPSLLRKECEKRGVTDGDFDICGLGETRTF